MCYGVFAVVWLTDISNREYIRLRAFADKSEMTVITFEPLKMNDTSDWDPQWEEWNCYYEPLMIPLSDFKRLLSGYFNKIYPTRDAIDGTPEKYFDVCSPNWIGEKDWRIIISAIQADLESFSGTERKFYESFLDWLDEALKHTSIIVAEGNL